MKLDLKSLTKIIEPVKKFLAVYGKWVMAFMVVCVFGFIFYRISYFNSVQPSEDSINEKLNNLQRPRIDKDIINKLQNLEHDNIQVQSLFNQARDNPFTE